MISLGFMSALSEKFDVGDINVLIVNLIIASVLIFVGILLGMLVKFIGRKMIERSGIGRTAKKNFIDLFLTIIKWSILILFVSLALEQLGIPQMTSWLTNILVVIPALVGALVLIGVGFAIAVYLRDLIEDSELLEKGVLSRIFFYFILFVFMIFAIKTALISQDKNTVNLIIIILTAVISAGLAYWSIKKK